MKYYSIILICLILTGCTTVDSDTVIVPSSHRNQGPRADLTNIKKVREGMNYEEVMGLMGTQVKIGVQQGESTENTYGTVGMRNPYRIEMLEVKGVRHMVVFFLTQINDSDGEVTDDELTPVVFKDDVLMGKGWGYLRELTIN